MSMPPMPGPPNMRGMGPMGTPMAGAPPPHMGAPPPQAPPQAPPSGPGSPPPLTSTPSSKRRAYPTAHLAANSVSFTGGFDAGAQYTTGAGAGGAQPGVGASHAGAQLFTPAAPDMASPPPPMQQSTSQYGHQHAPSAAPAAGTYAQNGAPGYGGMGALANQFQAMAVGGTGMSKGVSGSLGRLLFGLSTDLLSPLFPRTLCTRSTSPRRSQTSTRSRGLLPTSSCRQMRASPRVQRRMPIRRINAVRSMPCPPLPRSCQSPDYRWASSCHPTARLAKKMVTIPCPS